MPFRGGRGGLFLFRRGEEVSMVVGVERRFDPFFRIDDFGFLPVCWIHLRWEESEGRWMTQGIPSISKILGFSFS